MTPITCGLLHIPCRLAAVVLGPGGGARRAIRAALTDDARFGLVQYLAALGAELVVTDGLLAALAQVAALTDPARLAALLARMPRVPLLRAQLRRLATPAADPRQVPLL